jgi:hypothetical protein
VKNRVDGENNPDDHSQSSNDCRNRKSHRRHILRASLSELYGNLALMLDRLDFYFEPWKSLAFVVVVWLFVAMFVPIPFVILLFSGRVVEACGWVSLWIGLLIFLDHRAEVRRGKAKAGLKARYYPNAVKEYIELTKET